METHDIILLVLSILIVILLVSLLLLIVRNNKRKVNLDISDDLYDIKGSIGKTIQQSILDFNDRVNQKLMDNQNSSKEEMYKLQYSLFEELHKFQNRINDKMNDEFKVLNTSVENKMTSINTKVEERLDKGFVKTNETFNSILERMTIIDQAQQKIEGLSTEMVSLQALLSNNQKRGAFGEYQLNQFLFNTYGENQKCYSIQHSLKEGKDGSVVRADAVIYMPPPYNMLCIDSKFPLTSYAKLVNEKVSEVEEKALLTSMHQEVKKHVDDISKKYIIKDKTADFAWMFIPSDGVLALIHSKLPMIVEYASKKNVILVSPTLIVPLLLSYRSMLIDYERSVHAKEIGEQIKLLSKDFEKFGEEWTKLHDNIEKLSKQSIDVNKRVDRITTKFGKIKIANIEEEKEGE